MVKVELKGDLKVMRRNPISVRIEKEIPQAAKPMLLAMSFICLGSTVDWQELPHFERSAKIS